MSVSLEPLDREDPHSFIVRRRPCGLFIHPPPLPFPFPYSSSNATTIFESERTQLNISRELNIDLSSVEIRLVLKMKVLQDRHRISDGVPSLCVCVCVRETKKRDI